MLAALLVVPGVPCHAAEVDFEEVTALSADGSPSGDFLPGEAIRYRAAFEVIDPAEGRIVVRLRISGHGWFETLETQGRFGAGRHEVTWGGGSSPLFASAAANPGKVALIADVRSESEQVICGGRRHGYLTLHCPGDRPTGVIASIPVGSRPVAMALTPDHRYLYVTSRESRNITVIDAETLTVAAEISDNQQIGEPAGVAASPNGVDMLVADYRLRMIHVFDAREHVRKERILVEADGPMNLGDLVANPARNEFYVADVASPRLFKLNADTYETEILGLQDLAGPPMIYGLRTIQVLVDPRDPNLLYALSQQFHEVIQLDVEGNLLGVGRAITPSSAFPAWTMIIHPDREEVYTVTNPRQPRPPRRTYDNKTKVNRAPLDDLTLLLDNFGTIGVWVGDLSMRDDGRYAYGIDSFRGELLLVDLDRLEDLSGCAVPVRAGGSFIYEDPERGRLYVANAGRATVDVIE